MSCPSGAILPIVFYGVPSLGLHGAKVINREFDGSHETKGRAPLSSTDKVKKDSRSWSPGIDVSDSSSSSSTNERLEPEVSLPAAPMLHSSQSVDQIENVLAAVLTDAQQRDFLGYSKHDALNAGWLEALAGKTRFTRLVATQLVMRSPLHIRPLIAVERGASAYSAVQRL